MEDLQFTNKKCEIKNVETFCEEMKYQAEFLNEEEEEAFN